jgi:serine/threonine protein kinase
MGATNPDRIHATLLRAREMPQELRQPFLEELRDSDPALFADIEPLLRAQNPAMPGMSSDPAETIADGSQSHTASPLAPGLIIAGYQIVDKIADGGMGTVWRAIQLGNRRHVALKVMRFDGPSAKQRARFELEMQASAKLEHENIARVYDSRIEGSTLFYVMELIDGPRLDQYVRQANASPEEIARLLIKVCDAIEVAHAAGITHRDLKPSNVLVTRAGVPKVLDFGLAKVEEATAPAMTMAGDIAGTPHYMAPEQAAGQLSDIGPLSDIYSLGVILYELLTGSTPFRGNLTAILHQILRDDPTPPRKLNNAIPADLEAICLKAMAKEPSRRYASAADMREDLGRFLDSEPVQARPASVLFRILRWASHPKRIVNTGLIDIIQGWLLLIWNAEGLLELMRHVDQGPTARPKDLAIMTAFVVVSGAMPAIICGHLILRRMIFPMWIVLGVSAAWFSYLLCLVLGVDHLDFGGFYPPGPFRNTFGTLLCLWSGMGIVIHVISLTAYYTHRSTIRWMDGLDPTRPSGSHQP